MEGAGGSGEPSRSAREQRQGAAIARQLARELRQSTTLFAQQEPRRATSGQNSPSTPPLTAFPGQNSPSTPEMAQFGAIYACRESFVPFSPPRSQAGRVLYRTQGRDRASQHNSTPGPTGLEDAGGSGGTGEPGRGAGCRLAGPSWVGRATATQISHAIRLVQISTNAENAAIPTMQIQCLNKLLGNCMRNCCADRPGRGAARRRRGLAGLRDATPRPPHTNFACNSIGPNFNKRRKRCNSNDANSMFEQAAGELHAKLLCRQARPRGRQAAAGPGRASRRDTETTPHTFRT